MTSTRARSLRPCPPPLQAAHTVLHVPAQPSQPSPSARQRRHGHSVCPVPPHTGHAFPWPHKKTAGQRLRVVTRRVGGQGAHTSSFSSCSWRHSRAVPAATIALHTTSCCTTKLTALSSTLAWRPTKEAGGHGRRRVLVCGRPGSPTTSGAELQLFGRAATPSPRAPGARQVHWSTCVRAAIARWKQLRRAADRVCPPRWQRPKERVCVAEQVAASLAERSAMAA